jgi:acylphosphatase
VKAFIFASENNQTGGSMTDNYRLRLVLRGRVQGVGFRYFVIRKAESFPVTGYVMNLPGQTVEVVAEGERPVVEAFMEAVGQGPSNARITEQKLFIEIPSGSFAAFCVKY